MEAVVVQGLTYRYQPGGPLVLKGIDFHVSRGEIVAVTGLSGCGKSTLCYSICGAFHHNRGGVMTGQVLLNGKNIRERRAASLALEVGMVFQDPDTQLFLPTVEDEIAFVPENLCLPSARIRERVEQVLDLLGLAALREANPHRLSGGEKHLVALAAVLALDPPVLVLDEVMSQLDQLGKEKVAAALKRLRNMGKAIIAVEHNLEAVSLADRLLVMEKGELLSGGRTAELLADRELMEARGLLYDPSGSAQDS
jgi:energy-coupling factor transport system ATP-binding protein